MVLLILPFWSIALYEYSLVLPKVLLKSVDYKECYEITSDIKKPESLTFKGYSGLYGTL
jgi:hypothetical protein